MEKTILVAGGAGYIGSTTARRLIRDGYKVIVFDNLSTGHRAFVPTGASFIKGDLKNFGQILSALKRHKPLGVMHFAASSLVAESVAQPLKYYENNVCAGVSLLRAMQETKTRYLILSSTAATYGEPKRIPVRETDPTSPTNPYGWTKRMLEWMLADVSRVSNLRYASLRYFNACGADGSGESGEKHDPETHLIPNILKALTGEKKELQIFGGNYPTKDGTCLRDYVHVDDLADAHIRALKKLVSGMPSGIFNLGSGSGYTILELVAAVERVTGMQVPRRMMPRRPGDPARLVADAGKARKILGWKPQRSLDEIVRTAWKWEASNAKRP